jgi:very-short-patch-repair endonuclease
MRASANTIAKARLLRRALSPPEARLWTRLRARSPDRPAFRRQHPVGPYVLDFYCAKARFAVEIDGIAHDLGDRPERDERRSVWLAARGIRVVRVAASELTGDFDEIVDGLLRTAAALVAVEAPSTALRAVPLPRQAGEDGPSLPSIVQKNATDAGAKR